MIVLRMIPTIAMNEENKMDDTLTQTARSESAFSGTSDDMNRQSENRECHKAESRVTVLPAAVDCKTRFTEHAVPYNHSFALHLPKNIMPPHGKDEVIELWVSRGKSPRIKFPLYTIHRRVTRNAIVSLFQVKTRDRERWKVGTPSIYSIESFLRDFNANRPVGFEDVEITLVNSQHEMRLGGVTIQLGYCRLWAIQGEAVFDVEICGIPELRIRKSKTKFRLQRLPQREPISSLRARSDALIIDYRRTEKWKQQATRVIELPRKPVGTSTMMVNAKEIEFVSAPATFEGTYVVQIPELLEKDARDRIRIATSPAEYSMVRGEIGEDIINRILDMIGSTEILNHPRSKSAGPRNSEKKGPDSLRLVAGGEMAFFEMKWWKQFNMAVWDSRQLIRAYCNKFTGPDGSPVSRGYIAVLDWQLGSLIARLYIERVV
jgi:hypothetical protein